MKTQQAPHEQPTPPRPPVAVRGRGDGLRIVVHDQNDPTVGDILRDQLAQRSGSFFSGGSVRLEMASLPLDMALAARIAEIVDEAGMQLVSIGTGDTDRTSRSRPAAPAHASAPSGEGALLLTGTVRSGQRVAHDGDIVVIGDVNPGSEVIAGGHVVVWGRLRGIVEAGLADGADDAVVCALDLAPTQLRIGPALARAPEEPDREPVPEVARQSDGSIIVDAWR